MIYALTGNPKHPDDVLIGLQDDGTRWREGPTGTYNQVFGGDGFGVGWSQASDLVSLASVYYSFIIRDVVGPPSTQTQMARWLDRDRRVVQSGAHLLQHLDCDPARVGRSHRA